MSKNQLFMFRGLPKSICPSETQKSKSYVTTTLSLREKVKYQNPNISSNLIALKKRHRRSCEMARAQRDRFYISQLQQSAVTGLPITLGHNFGNVCTVIGLDTDTCIISWPHQHKTHICNDVFFF